MSNEKEISGPGPNKPTPTPAPPAPKKPVERDITSESAAVAVAATPVSDGVSGETFNAAVGDLSGKLSQISSNTELLDILINTPEGDLLPWQEVPLPSRGAYYNGKLPGGLVRIRPMGIHADKILATQALAQSGQSIDYLFDNCVQFPQGFSAEDLLAGDRVFLLYALRGITHGNRYEFMISCPNCEATASQEYDLNLLAETMTYPNPALGSEPFKVVLPYMSKLTGKETFVRVRLLRGKDISLMAKRQRFKKRIAPSGARNIPKGPNSRPMPQNRNVVIDETLTENLNMIVVDFMGTETDPVKIQLLVAKLHSSDTAEIREFLRNNSPGLDTQIQVTCPECNTEFRTELPITETFFRPSKS